MKSWAPIVLVGVMLAFSTQLADSARRPSLQAGSVNHFQGQCENDPDGTRFAAKACYLNYSRFDPARAGFGRLYHRPTCDRSKELPEPKKDVLARAYVLAPNYVKAKLCRLTQVFVTQPRDLWGSWGFWEAPDRPPGTGTFIAISDDFIGKKSLAEEENDVLDKLLKLHVQPRSQRLPYFATADASDPGAAMLAVFAHELGHILLADTDADGTDPRHPRRRVSGPPQSACFEHAFLGQSWNARIFHRHMRRWIPFAEQDHNRQRTIVFSLKRLQREARARDYVEIGKEIMEVYQSREFVSPFAAVRPEEDFVETYKYKVLADVAGDLTIRFPIEGEDRKLSEVVRSPIIERKIRCIGDLGLLSGEP